MLQTVDGAISPTGMMQRTLQLLMSQVSHITCCPILPAPTLPHKYFTDVGLPQFIRMKETLSLGLPFI